MSTLKTDNITPNGSILTVTGGLTLSGAAHFSGGLTSSGLVRFSNSTASTTTSTGALVVTGGLGVGGAVNVGGAMDVDGLLTLAGATSSAIISCATAPTQGQHLANKTYVDANGGWVGKSWTSYILNSVGTTRVSATDYTSPAYPILVMVTCNNNGGTTITVGGTAIITLAATNNTQGHSFIVPSSTTYKVTASSGIQNWAELR